MKSLTMGLKGMALAIGCLALLSCNPLENKTESSSLLIVQNLTGVNTEGQEVSYLESDVVRLDNAGNPFVTADPAVVTFSAKLLDLTSSRGPSQYNDIIIDRYVVRYTRVEGKNQEGVDVPYAFEGSLSTMVQINSVTEISFPIVRAAAKLEPPLVNLASTTAEGVLQVTARVDFYGHDMMNKKITATGYLAIFFANYADK
ncbi:MAG: hypothetical protein MUQ00_16495 [Candidatus Aminicenantes bacterium]|nr:hypothetical protein [Candidatus Aminicenantes bacterium]